MNNSPSNVSMVKLTKEEIKKFLVKFQNFLKELNINDENINNLMILIEPIVETCQKLPMFCNCVDLKGKLTIMTAVSARAMMVILGMLNEIMCDGDLSLQNKELLSRMMKNNNLKFCPA